MATSPADEVTIRAAFLAMIALTRTKTAARTRIMPSAACRASSTPLPNQEACPGWPAAGSVTYRLTLMPRANWTISTIRMARLARRRVAWRDAIFCADGGVAVCCPVILLTLGFWSQADHTLAVLAFGWGVCAWGAGRKPARGLPASPVRWPWLWRPPPGLVVPRGHRRVVFWIRPRPGHRLALR